LSKPKQAVIYKMPFFTCRNDFLLHLKVVNGLDSSDFPNNTLKFSFCPQFSIPKIVHK